MFSKNKQKLIRSLTQKKFRDEYGYFVAEGNKLVLDLLPTMHCVSLFATSEWFAQHPTTKADELIEVSQEELSKVSNQKTAQNLLAIFKKPIYEYSIDTLANNLVLALDDIQDPGNLGTIIRVADWFGIYDVFCSKHTADVFSHKAVQATMGALARVRVHHVDLSDFLLSCKGKTEVFGTFLDGNDIYQEATLPPNGIILMGNEGNGISPSIEQYATRRLLIPNYPAGQSSSESLNVGIATAVVCAEFRRRQRGF